MSRKKLRLDRRPRFFLENQAAEVPSSKVSLRVPCSPWMNSTIVAALVSSRHSMISFP
jgi:hypothetical protein